MFFTSKTPCPPLGQPIRFFQTCFFFLCLICHSSLMGLTVWEKSYLVELTFHFHVLWIPFRAEMSSRDMWRHSSNDSSNLWKQTACARTPVLTEWQSALTTERHSCLLFQTLLIGRRNVALGASSPSCSHLWMAATSTQCGQCQGAESKEEEERETRLALSARPLGACLHRAIRGLALLETQLPV